MSSSCVASTNSLDQKFANLEFARVVNETSISQPSQTGLWLGAASGVVQSLEYWNARRILSELKEYMLANMDCFELTNGVAACSRNQWCAMNTGSPAASFSTCHHQKQTCLIYQISYRATTLFDGFQLKLQSSEVHVPSTDYALGMTICFKFKAQ
jgi:hypothetical protein